MTFPALQRVLPAAKKNMFLLELRSGSETRTELLRISTALEPLPTRESGRPRELEDLADVQDLPSALAAILGVLAFATLAHTLLTSIRRRRRDLAVLKTIGFTRRQVALAVVWHASTLAVIALVIGLPVGLLAGRRVWDAFAEGLGAVPEATFPTIVVLLAVPAALLLANAIASVPAVLAGRTRAAVALRTE
jgi:ABC-type antimicrobial peptide transport system permease subunit